MKTMVLGVMLMAATMAMAQTNGAHVATVGAQVKDDLFAGTEQFAKGASEVTEVNLDPRSMGMVSGDDKKVAKKMHFMVIHEYKYDKPGAYKMEDVEVYLKKLEDGSWSCSVKVRKASEASDICSRMGPGGREMVIVEAKPQKLSFIHMGGVASLDELGKMGAAGKDGQ